LDMATGLKRVTLTLNELLIEKLGGRRGRGA
jgi:hypothetical protein